MRKEGSANAEMGASRAIRYDDGEVVYAVSLRYAIRSLVLDPAGV
jgi:hypothetical protein